MSAPMLDELFNHLVFPPRLPGAQSKIAAVEKALLDRLQSTAATLLDQVPGQFRASYEALQTSLQACRNIHINRNLDRRTLARELLNLQPNIILILHITEQNAGVLIWRRSRQARFSHSTILVTDLILTALMAKMSYLRHSRLRLARKMSLLREQLFRGNFRAHLWQFQTRPTRTQTFS
jgi:hypothetical protein